MISFSLPSTHLSLSLTLCLVFPVSNFGLQIECRYEGIGHGGDFTQVAFAIHTFSLETAHLERVLSGSIPCFAHDTARHVIRKASSLPQLARKSTVTGYLRYSNCDANTKYTYGVWSSHRIAARHIHVIPMLKYRLASAIPR